MKTHQMMSVVGFAVLLPACGGNDTTTSEYGIALAHQLDALSAEQTGHFSEISTISSVGLIGPAESDHAQRMDDHLAEMSRALGGLMACAGGTAAPLDVAGLAALTHDLHLECDQHGILMLSAQAMANVGTEEGRHQTVTGNVIEKMRRQLNTMMQPGSGYDTCSRCPSCDMKR